MRDYQRRPETGSSATTGGSRRVVWAVPADGRRRGDPHRLPGFRGPRSSPSIVMTGVVCIGDLRLGRRAQSIRSGARDPVCVGRSRTTYWRAEVGPGRRPRNKREARAWLEAHPETPATSVCRGSACSCCSVAIDEVRAAISRGPTETPIDRFDRGLLHGDRRIWMETGAADVAALRSAADGLDAEHAAAGVLAVADVESRLALEAGGDIWAPFIAAEPGSTTCHGGAGRWFNAAVFGAHRPP